MRSYLLALALAVFAAAACDASLGEGGAVDASVAPGDPDAAPAPVIDAAPLPADAAPPVDSRPCTEGDARVEDPATGTCYIYVAQLTTWDDARIACQGLGAHLATATTLAENQLVTPLAGLLDVWVGGTDAASEALWVWVTAETMGFTNWRSGEPNNNGQNGTPENCMVLEGDNNGLWDDRNCGNTYGYICERE